MGCSFEVVEQEEQNGFVRVKVECEGLERPRWFNFTPSQIETGRWRKHVKKYIEEYNSTGVNDLTGSYTED